MPATMARIMSGGTALPICENFEDTGPHGSNSCGKVCIAAASLQDSRRWDFKSGPAFNTEMVVMVGKSPSLFPPVC